MPSRSPGGEVRALVRSGIGWVTVARPEKRNALTASMWGAIPGVFEAMAARDDLRLVVLQGAEGTFGAGADLEDVLSATRGRPEAVAYCTQVVMALLAVASCPVPTASLVAGVAAGGGAELALASDVRIADPSASFAFPFARLGIVPDRFTLDRLVGLVGVSAARRLVLTGETVDAARALSVGLIDEVTVDGGLPAAAASWARVLADGSAKARAGMKQALLARESSLDVATLIGPMVESFLGGEVEAAARRFLEKKPS